MSDPMDEMAAFTKMWIKFHEARPDVGLTWFIQHYQDGALVDLAQFKKLLDDLIETNESLCAEIETLKSEPVPAPPRDFHNLRVSVENDYITATFTCTAPEGAQCRLICTDIDCEYWTFDGTHSLIDGGRCGAKEWFDAVDWLEVHESTGHESLLYDGPVNAFWDGEDFQWQIDGAPVEPVPAPRGNTGQCAHCGQFHTAVYGGCPYAPVPAPRLEHVLELRDDGWSLEHPQVCRESKSLLDCPVHAVVKSHEDEMELWEHGRFNVGLDEYGELEKLSSAPPVGTQPTKGN